MFYLIEYDKRQAVAKAATDTEFLSVLKENDLQMAFAIVGSEDDIAMEMSLKEMQGLHDSFPKATKRKIPDEDEGAALCWAMLNANKASVPTMSPKVRKALLKDGGGGTPAADSDASERPSGKPRRTPAATTTKAPTGGKRMTAKQLRGQVFIPGDDEPKAGIDRHFLWLCLEENLGEATYEDLIEFYKEAAEEKKGKEIKDTEAHARIVAALKKDNIRLAEEEDDL